MSSFIYIFNKKERRVILLKKKKPKPKNWFRFSVAERAGFEPACRKPDNRISSAARYDHFDTFP